MVHNRCRFKDKQMVKLQESPDDMPPGQTPHTVILYAHDDMVDAVQPGDRVAVSGKFISRKFYISNCSRPKKIMKSNKSI